MLGGGVRVRADSGLCVFSSGRWCVLGSHWISCRLGHPGREVGY